MQTHILTHNFVKFLCKFSPYVKQIIHISLSLIENNYHFFFVSLLNSFSSPLISGVSALNETVRNQQTFGQFLHLLSSKKETLFCIQVKYTKNITKVPSQFCLRKAVLKIILYLSFLAISLIQITNSYWSLSVTTFTNSIRHCPISVLRDL